MGDLGTGVLELGNYVRLGRMGLELDDKFASGLASALLDLNEG